MTCSRDGICRVCRDLKVRSQLKLKPRYFLATTQQFPFSSTKIAQSITFRAHNAFPQTLRNRMQLSDKFIAIIHCETPNPPEVPLWAGLSLPADDISSHDHMMVTLLSRDIGNSDCTFLSRSAGSEVPLRN